MTGEIPRWWTDGFSAARWWGAGNPSGGLLRTVPAVVRRHLCRADVKISPGIMRVGARWCDGPQRSTLDHTPQAVGMATPFAREQEPAKNRRRRPPPGHGEDLHHGQRASPQDAQDLTAGDFVEVKFVGRGSTILERLREALPWPLGSSASGVSNGSGRSLHYPGRWRFVG